MTLQRVFLDWSTPCLPAAAAWLIDRAPTTSPIDLRRTMCILPGARAGRLLLAHLLDQADRRGATLIPPRVLTPGAMTDSLLQPRGCAASSTESLLAWTKALQSADGASLAPLLPSPPAADDLLAWRGLAATVVRLHEELAGARLSFTNVADKAGRMNMPSESARWSVLHELQENYVRLLQSNGLIDLHAARELALREPTSPGAEELDTIALIGLIDLNAVQRGVLTRVADRIIALVHAPPETADGFDDIGCVKPEWWESQRIDIDSSQIRVCDRPEDQARETMQSIADLGGEFASQQITIGLGDADLASSIERAAGWAGLHTHSAHGRDLARTSPARFLKAAADWLSERRFAHLAALLRHPDVELFISRNSSDPKSKIQNPQTASWLTLLDTYFADHLHGRLAGPWLGKPETQRQLKAVHDAINDLLNPLGSDRGKRLPAQWAQPILDVLANVYGCDAEDERMTSSADACRLVRDALAEITQAPEGLQPQVDASTAIHLLLADIAGQSITEDPRRDQIEMLGWLELHLDPAPVLIITGFNDGAIPESVTADAFLPDSLRTALGLANNQRRYARDAYQLSAILHSREHVTIIAGRRTARGEPLSPSRLLLACDDQTLVKRIRLMCREEKSHHRMPPLGLAQPEPASATQFVVPKLPQSLAVPDKLSVTAFKDYLNCPYRFALKWLVNLKSADDCAVEMDPLCFGSLAHDTLNDFGADSTAANLTEAKDIEEFLLVALDRRWRERFGDDPLPAVRLQIARLQQRLRSFAKFQSKQRAEGWIIRHCEKRFSENNSLDIPGDKPMLISGRIDRIDQHETTGAWRIMDYKTSESGESPHQTHLGRKTIPDDDELEWQDLQLPLYWLLASHNGIGGHVQLGYIVLPKLSDGTELLFADWSAAHLDAAIEKAREVVRDIRAGKFLINPEFHSPFDEFARICQTQVFADDDDADAEAAA